MLKKKKSFKSDSISESCKIFSLDISQERTGWAYLEDDKVQDYGAITRENYFDKDAVTFNSSEFGNMLAAYCQKVWQVFETCVSEFGEPSHFVVEDLNIRYIKAAKSLLQFQAAAKIAISQNTAGTTEIHMINNQTVKAFMGVRTLKKNMTKEVKALAKFHKVKEVKILMVDRIAELYPETNLHYKENDEADAIAQAYTFYHKIIKGVKNAEVL
ncbi:hypothetical protein MEO43_25380 [Dolichospermum sp. ST_sed5]|nr:hypothetical protein [Dolichospermum sp. ST_sed5]